LKSGKKITRLTYDHKTTDDGEAKRIKDKGGFVINKRVNGILSVTRALGDHAMKEWVTSEPYFSEVIIEEDNNCLILACDGIWDVINDEEVFEYIKDLEDAQEMSDFLLEKSIKLGSTDNISVMVVIF
jgi:serine/threonine protein phosphatase PrpC